MKPFGIKKSLGKRGHSLVEATVSIVVVMPLLLPILDGSIYLYGVSVTDDACRQAARAASMGPPNAVQTGAADKNARAALECFGTTRGPICIQTDFKLSETLARPLPQPPFGGLIDGSVTVCVHCKIDLPFWSRAFSRGPVNYISQQSYPITWAVPSISSLTRRQVGR